MTSISSVNQNSNTRRGTQIGLAVGSGVGTGYLVKDAPRFKKAIAEGVETLEKQGLSLGKKQVKIASFAGRALVLGAVATAGALIGKGIGKIIDVVNQKKQMKAALNENMAKLIEEKVQEAPVLTLEELEAMAKEIQAEK